MSERNNQSAFSNVDLVTFSLYLALLGVGWLMVYTVNYEEVSQGGILEFFSSNIGKQTIWMVISLVVFFFVLLIDRKFWETFAYLFYIISIVLLVAVLFFGSTIKGATSWFNFGSFSFQPSEVAKFSTCLAMASYLSSYNANLKELRGQLFAFSIFAVPLVLIFAQPDAGSALVFLSFVIVLFREGLPTSYYIFGISAAVLLLLGFVFEPISIIVGILLVAILILAYNQPKQNLYWVLGALGLAILSFIPQTFIGTGIKLGVLAILFAVGGIWVGYYQRKGILVRGLAFSIVLGAAIAFAANYGFNQVLKPHQQERINIWLQPDKADPRGALYNVLQSKLAISSGGFTGKGFLKGTLTRLDYVPEQTTDFIFCTIGEEQGFVGSLGIIGLFLVFLIRLTILAERQRANFPRQYIYGVAGMIFFHVIINIGMTMGLVPIIGIPLPLISKGGSSFLGFTIMIAVLLRLDGDRYQV